MFVESTDERNIDPCDFGSLNSEVQEGHEEKLTAKKELKPSGDFKSGAGVLKTWVPVKPPGVHARATFIS